MKTKKKFQCWKCKTTFYAVWSRYELCGNCRDQQYKRKKDYLNQEDLEFYVPPYMDHNDIVREYYQIQQRLAKYYGISYNDLV